MASVSVAELAVEIALQEAAAGVFERANDNRGDRIDEYQQSASGRLGEAWCLQVCLLVLRTSGPTVE
jgi:hypothetical protein